MTPDLRVPLSALPGFDPTGLRIWSCGESFLVVDGDPAFEGIDLLVDGTVQPFDRAIVAVDLSDAPTRDRVARYVAGRVGVGPTCVAGWWWPLMPVAGSPAWGLGYDPERKGSWNAFGSGRERDVPSLADLDPADDTRLPDGSRVVDAVALARVAVHVGGAA